MLNLNFAAMLGSSDFFFTRKNMVGDENYYQKWLNERKKDNLPVSSQ